MNPTLIADCGCGYHFPRKFAFFQQAIRESHSALADSQPMSSALRLIAGCEWVADDPALAAYKGAARIAASPLYSHLAWTKRAYEEHGSARLHGHETPVKRRAA